MRKFAIWAASLAFGALGVSACGGEGAPGSSECADGSWAVPGAGCVAWTDCMPGEWEKEPGTATSDRVCLACVSGLYSTETNAASCSAATQCGTGYTEEIPPTPTSDRSCNIDEWERWFGTPMFESVYDIATDADSNVYAVGVATASAVDHTLVSFIASYSRTGEQRWFHSIEGPYTGPQGAGIAVVGDALYIGYPDARYERRDLRGNLVWSKRIDAHSLNDLSVNSQGRGALIARYPDYTTVIGFGSDGEVTWESEPVPPSSELYELALDDSGSVFATGIHYAPYADPEALDALFVKKYQDGGALAWDVEWETNVNTYSSLALGTDGQIYVLDLTDNPDFERYLQQVRADGSLGWRWHDTARNFDGRMHVTGSEAGLLLCASEDSQLSVDLIDYSGQSRWTYQVGSQTVDHGGAIATSPDGAIYLGGSSTGDVGARFETQGDASIARVLPFKHQE